MRSFKVTLEYDGTDFHGFQLQRDLRTVQGVCEQAIERLVGKPVRVHGAGRTDTGVHAAGQVISFKANTAIPLVKMCAALNSGLPRDASVKRVEEVDERFHARFSATSRSYLYVVMRSEIRSALFRRYTYWCPHELDVDAMKQSAAKLIGSMDFTSFASSMTESRTPIRRLTRFQLSERGKFLFFSIEANAFLRGMVRNMVGTLLEVGRSRMSTEDVTRIIVARDRRVAGPAAPPEGLCLTRVRYDVRTDDKLSSIELNLPNVEIPDDSK